MNPKLTWSLVRTFFLSGITGGIIPTIFLPKRFADFAKAEQLQFWHLAEWLRLQTGDTQAAAATETAKRVTPGLRLRFASLVFVIVAIGIACTALPHNGAMVPRWFALTLPQLELPQQLPFFQQRGVPWHEEWRGNWHSEQGGGWREPFHQDEHVFSNDSPGQWFHIYHPNPSVSDQPVNDDESFGGRTSGVPADESIARIRSPLVSSDLINAYALAMSGAALCWLIEINAHIGRVRRFVEAFNLLSSRYGVGPVRPPGLHLGIRPLWVLGAAATCALGGFWAAPVMLAAGAHRRYIRSTSQRLRSDLARRQREVLLARRPAIRVPASTHLLGICPRENCRASYPPEAVYCRRCGTKLDPA